VDPGIDEIAAGTTVTGSIAAARSGKLLSTFLSVIDCKTPWITAVLNATVV
jgi:hypothetical protein